MTKEILESQESKNRYHVNLQYSCDNLNETDENKKRQALQSGQDFVTKALKDAEVPFSIYFCGDFHFSEPILERVTKTAKNGRKYELFNSSEGAFSYSPICGPRNVLEHLVRLGVLTPKKNG